MIVEIVFNLGDQEFEELQDLLRKGRYLYYIEPPYHFASLEAVECPFEGNQK